jgi:cutinase
MGVIVGLPFLNMLKSTLGADNVDYEGVDYNNGVAGYLSGGDSAGSTKMAQMIRDKASSCPSTKIVVSGYRYAS